MARAAAPVTGDTATAALQASARIGSEAACADSAAHPAARDRRGLHARRGAVIGAAFGLGFALFMSSQLEASGRQTLEAAGAVGAAGALVGALLGALVP